MGSGDPELGLFLGQSFAKGVVSTALAGDYTEDGGRDRESAGFKRFGKHVQRLVNPLQLVNGKTFSNAPECWCKS